jgi:murein L,D-transpeptidase YcbB/YkuD
VRVAYALLAVAAGLSPLPAFAQAPRWDAESARELLDAIQGAQAEGLDPRDYSPEPLLEAAKAGPGPALDAAATERFRHLARDYTQGHVGPEDRLSWFIAGPTLSDEAADALMTRALAERRIGPVLAELLPTDARYLRLRAALSSSSKDPAALQTIRVNMERWRWLPRALGARRIEVNAPSYTLTLTSDGRIVSTHKVIVGKPSTPTPQFSAVATGMILNPWWEIPESIVAESVGALVRTRPAVARARGYVWSNGSYRQRPGPNNSLGQVKMIMPNPFNVYIHDTPSKTLFARPVRALSHGCIRTEAPFDLAAALLAGQPGWARADIDRAVASGDTFKVSLPKPTPVYVLYFTAEVDASGKLVVYPDIYGRDAVVAAELTDRGALDYVG